MLTEECGNNRRRSICELHAYVSEYSTTQNYSIIYRVSQLKKQLNFSDLVEHVANTKKKLEIVMDIKYHILAEIVGAGINIVSYNQEEDKD